MTKKFEAYEIAKQFYGKCKKVRLPDFLHTQLVRASSSVALNLAEGSGKRTEADRKKFFRNALGSVLECKAILELEDKYDKDLRELLERLGAITYNLARTDQKPKS